MTSNTTQKQLHIWCPRADLKRMFHWKVWKEYILKINENATLVLATSFKHGLDNSNFVLMRRLYFASSIKRLIFVLIHWKYTLFKSTCFKTSYFTPCNVEWFVFCHSALLVYWVDNVFLTWKCWYVFFTSKYSKIKSFKNANILRAGGSGRFEGRFPSCVWMYNTSNHLY